MLNKNDTLSTNYAIFIFPYQTTPYYLYNMKSMKISIIAQQTDLFSKPINPKRDQYKKTRYKRKITQITSAYNFPMHTHIHTVFACTMAKKPMGKGFSLRSGVSNGAHSLR